jgi:hypothetical protein
MFLDGRGNRQGVMNRILTGGLAAVAACIVALSAAAASAPTIKSFAPTHGPRNARVTISGTNLAGGRVTIGGHVSARTTWNAAGTTIVTYVPPGARLGQVVVKVTTRSGSVSASRKFVVNVVP